MSLNAFTGERLDRETEDRVAAGNRGIDRRGMNSTRSFRQLETTLLGVGSKTNLACRGRAPVEVVGASLIGGTCTLDNPRKITCTRATLAETTSANISVDVRSSEAGTFVGHFTATANNDGLPDNNRYDWAIVVRSEEHTSELQSR